MQSGDEDLLMRAAAGDERAFMEVYDRYSHRVFGLILKILRDRTEAEDVLQEVMWEVWRKASHYEPRLGSASAWILMMARARAIDRVRARQRRANNAAAFEAATASEHVQLDTTTSLDAEAAMRLLQNLPEDQRSVIELAFYDGLSREQIAHAQGIPVGTVKTRIRSGVTRLREMLQRESAAVA